MRLEKQSAEHVTEPLVGKVPFVKCRDHPVVEEVQFGVEELIVGLESVSEQAAFGLEFAFDRSACVRKHAAEGRDRPAVADKFLEEGDVLADAAEGRIGVDHHESEVEGEPKFFQDSPGTQMRLG